MSAKKRGLAQRCGDSNPERRTESTIPNAELNLLKNLKIAFYLDNQTKLAYHND